MITIARIGNNKTVTYAAAELRRYIKEIDKLALIDLRVYNSVDEAPDNAIVVGLDGSVAESELDEIKISITDGAGIITGSSPRAVLIAVYRFLHELGCRFLRPGKDGDVIPCRTLDKASLNVNVSERASYRHRSMCIEGTVCYDHVYNMIEWLPKVGMNGYFMQFHTPSAFFKRFHNTMKNPYMKTTAVSDEDIDRIWSALEEEIIKRGLDYHATGHGWTCEPFGIHATSWDIFEGEFPAEVKKYLAEIDGKRELWQGGVALNTNLCYSNPEVREKMNNAIVEYCKDHPAVNFLHFWLADGKNNHCECAECAKMRPSDHYVAILNDLDRKLTAAGILTKIVCLIYVDLLWEPEVNKIENPDRFVLMFAPITRTYSNAFTDYDPSERVELAPYVRNKLTMPSSVAENVARLSKWQKEQLGGDSFDFDYHLMWDHYTDPGYYECARILHTDMANLDKIGLDGMVSCQTQRAAFPTGLPMYSMAKALWDKTSEFKDVCTEYFTAAFGDDGKAVEEYLKTLSKLFDPVYMRGEKPKDPDGMCEKCREAKAVIEAFRNSHISHNAALNPSWAYLSHHAEIVLKYADLIIAYSTGTDDERKSAKAELLECIHSREPYIHEGFDSVTFQRIFGKYIVNL